ncbi:NSUN6 [Blepharisma stoltei]|uniref:SAM-dependent MTase RsmB/NOP-type domain-containing protein n=1 Tax=Blepharisma stoltei TaxID=1481888 RepID=A0AAU9JKQ1_9CILI|nr:unnamed protein product [Blepharisma stoltei]
MSKEYFLALYGEEGINVLKTPPPYTTLRVNTLKIDMNEAIRILELLFPRYDIKVHEKINDLLCIPVNGPFNIQPVEKAIFVDNRCGEAILRGSHIYAPGVLGTTSDFQKNEIVSIYSISVPINRGTKTTIENVAEPFYLGNGVCQMSRREIFSTNKGLAIIITEGIYQTPSFENLPKNLFFPQNEPSALVAHILDPKPGESILDMCASPGGKTTHISTLMQNQGELIALDKSKKRVEELKSNVDIWESFADVRKIDATKAKQRFGGKKFDKILLDAPCSGLGQRPKLSFQEINVDSTALYQKKFLEIACEMLKPGGILVYSTCTVTQEENQQNIGWAIENLELELINQEIMIGDASEPLGLTQVFSPISHSMGFFIAKLRRK